MNSVAYEKMMSNKVAADVMQYPILGRAYRLYQLGNDKIENEQEKQGQRMLKQAQNDINGWYKGHIKEISENPNRTVKDIHASVYILMAGISVSLNKFDEASLAVKNGMRFCFNCKNGKNVASRIGDFVVALKACASKFEITAQKTTMTRASRVKTCGLFVTVFSELVGLMTKVGFSSLIERCSDEIGVWRRRRLQNFYWDFFESSSKEISCLLNSSPTHKKNCNEDVKFLINRNPEDKDAVIAVNFLKKMSNMSSQSGMKNKNNNRSPILKTNLATIVESDSEDEEAMTL
jgi:hypothetical protein